MDRFHMLPEMSFPKRLTAVARRAALIVEDDPRLQTAMSEQLKQAGFRVLSATHFDAAVCHLATREPDIACIDVSLPSRSGYELCEHIRGSLSLSRLPILMTSDRGSPGDMAHAEDAGGNAFLRKPFSMRQFTDCVESLLHSTRAGALPRHELQVRAATGSTASDAGRGAQRPTFFAA